MRWWMFGGDARINDYVDTHEIPTAERLGIELERVPVADTAEAVQRVIAQRRAGQTDGGEVDLIWINGENFAAGKEAGLWLEDWVRLRSARAGSPTSATTPALRPRSTSPTARCSVAFPARRVPRGSSRSGSGPHP